MNSLMIERLRGTCGSPIKRVKRRAGYDSSEEEEARLQIKRLRIDDSRTGQTEETGHEAMNV